MDNDVRVFAAGDKRDDLFAGTPGPSMLRYAVSQAATGHAARGKVIMVLDIKSPCWSANCTRRSPALAMPHSSGRITCPSP